MKMSTPLSENVDIISSDSEAEENPESKQSCSNAPTDEPAKDETAAESLLKRAQLYQEYMNRIPIPSNRHSIIPFRSWTGLASSIKEIYGQPLHYLTKISLKEWDLIRVGAKDEDIPMDKLIHPSKAERTIWLLEEVHRVTASPRHLAKLWLTDAHSHLFVDEIFPSSSDCLPHLSDSQLEDQSKLPSLIQQGGDVPLGNSLLLKDLSPYYQGGSSRKRGNNFRADEDELLVSCWLNTSFELTDSDPIKSKNEFWRKVENYYIQRKNPDWPPRSLSSLTHRWFTINKCVSMFCGLLAQVEASHVTNVSPVDKIQQARNLYHSINKASFQYDHCWVILRNKEKWLDQFKKRVSPKRKSRMPYSPANPEFIDTNHDLGEENNTRKNTERKDAKERAKDKERKAAKERTKNEERKAAKQRTKVRKSFLRDTASLSNAIHELKEANMKIDEDKMQNSAIEHQAKLFETQKAQLLEVTRGNRLKNEILQREVNELKLQQKKQDEDILLIDTSAMDPEQKEYFRIRRMEILQRNNALI